MKKFTFCLRLLSISAICMLLYSFSTADNVDEYVNYLQKSFTEHYDFAQESSAVKKYELNVTNNGFCRYKRYFANGKIEYFAFKLAKFKDLDYYGTTTAGKLFLRTKSDDVIVQTYNDRAGDVDSMGTCIVIPLKNIEAEDLNQIKESLTRIGPNNTIQLKESKL
ncbi:hypothetical protein QWY86_06585 [Pedobacter aquatilis]|uniref:hypothetical protein n=1 Tax=Pedobacter aquatilis TaxID=351343 RepID=UPI0025B35C38|nr:hypothetical protein [Pedobacter aquatilis]MDN3586327.1 hypothetical protein [Pedobacter aquatilis]